MIAALKSPADSTWVMARVAALLNPYFEKDTPQSVRVMEAQDWAAALCEYPQWAIESAVRWWKSADNTERRKRPLEGDIQGRVWIEMNAIRAAEHYLAAPVIGKVPAREGVSKGDQAQRAAFAAKVLAGTGYGASKSGGQS